MSDFLELDESSPEYAIDKLVPETEAAKAIWQKHLLRYEARSRFWRPRFEIAKKCQKYMRRDIFTPGQRARYRETLKKWPIEPQEMKHVINSLAWNIQQLFPGSQITIEDETPPQNAASPEVVNDVVAWLKQQLKVSRRSKKALKEGLITGLPMCLLFNKIRGSYPVPGMIPLSVDILPWDAALPSEWFKEEDGSDIDEVMIVRQMKKYELFKTFPERKEAFLKHQDLLKQDKGYQEALLTLNAEHNANDRSNLLYNMVNQSRFDSINGNYFVIQDIFPILKKRRCWINEETMDVFIPPPDWENWRKQQWLDNNPAFSMSDEIDIATLWVTTISSDGFVWENREHWFQEEDAKLPAAFFVADMVDNMPTGAGEDMLPWILMRAVCLTEGLSQVRKGTSRTTFITEGAVKNPSRLNAELSAEEGVVILKKGFDKNSFVTETRKPNNTFFDLGDKVKEELQMTHMVNNAMMGVTAPRQSDRAKSRELTQGMAPQNPYVENYTNFVLQVEQLLCSMIPRVLTEPMIIELKDEFGQNKKPVEVNQMGFDYSGQARIVANDLTSARYRVVPVQGDDSKTSREQQMIDFMRLLEAVGNQLFKLDPIFLGQTLGMFPNRFAREASKFMIEYGQRNMNSQQQQAQAELQFQQDKQAQRAQIEREKLQTPRFAFKLSPKDIAEAPEGAKIMWQMMQSYNQQSWAGQGQAQMQQEEDAQYQEVPEEAM